MKKFIDQIIITLFFLYLLISKYIIIISYNYSIFIIPFLLCVINLHRKKNIELIL